MPTQPETECILCSEDWQDIVIIYIPQLNHPHFEDNYVTLSLR